MSIKKLESGEWLVDCRPEGRGGPRVRKKFRSKNEALYYQNRVMGDGARGEFERRPKRDERRLSELVGLWFKSYGRTLKSGEERRRALESMADRMGDPTASDFNTSHFTQYRAERLEGLHGRANAGSGRKKGEKAKPVSANTLNHELAYLRAMFNELERLGEWRGDNPVGKVRQLKFDETEMAYLAAEQIPPLLQALQELSPKARVVAEVCLSTGARWSEAEGLTPRQVRAGRIQYTKTKSSKNRAVPITKDLQDRILAALPFGDCYKKFGEAVELVGLDLPPGQLTHVLRHTFASHYMMKGGDILTLQRVLGHASLAMTMRYAHFSPGHLADVVYLNPLATQPPPPTSVQ
ncbi:TPA: tyrosine-type recombinase/integrase [Pseudomonas aeruginosa]|uniref:phage integrase n=1 Tax=Pseudomonas aeruginosa group TaxID=136841 RepID=UPI00053D5400|nr:MULTISPECIES: tyrosine-type recombinase/integrase [Pseudomonas aeruginosa group]KSD65764.1 integrase [Pseudomonas aeruginosa]MCT9630649.1 tyrosine-type recombinase/integrase [Pseudomonas aeruginosa]MCW8031840.1 tyrosine-type recombinase/integrase [Pseudomonas aeruginosa]MDV2883309.1 tyrosine-type recombinase/integrase [Pseudomonas aeruginosa]OTH87952.1 integrase [Pseudomonas aeruginosa]